MREKVGHFLEWLTAPFAFAGLIALIWVADLRIGLTFLTCGVFSLIIGGIMNFDI